MVYEIYLSGTLVEECLSFEDAWYTIRNANWNIVDEDEDTENLIIKLRVEEGDCLLCKKNMQP